MATIKDNKVNDVYETREYSKFKWLKGNRVVDEARVAKVRDSIKEVGIVRYPILCNEKMEIIDGQARFTVCKEDRLPVYYIIEPGIGIDECIHMNINQGNWRIIDYIDSYAERENLNYVRLKNFLERNPKYQFTTKVWAVFRSEYKNKSQALKDGRITVTDQMINDAEGMLGFFDNFDGIITNRPMDLYIALGYCYVFPEVDNARLIKKLENSRAFVNIANTQDAIGVIEDEYNRRLREHVYIEKQNGSCCEKQNGAAGRKRGNERTSDGRKKRKS